MTAKNGFGKRRSHRRRNSNIICRSYRSLTENRKILMRQWQKWRRHIRSHFQQNIPMHVSMVQCARSSGRMAICFRMDTLSFREIWSIWKRKSAKISCSASRKCMGLQGLMFYQSFRSAFYHWWGSGQSGFQMGCRLIIMAAMECWQQCFCLRQQLGFTDSSYGYFCRMRDKKTGTGWKSGCYSFRGWHIYLMFMSGGIIQNVCKKMSRSNSCRDLEMSGLFWWKKSAFLQRHCLEAYCFLRCIRM